MYLIDTDILVFHLRGHSAVSHQLTERLRDDLAISAITYAELLVGARKSLRAEENVNSVHRLAKFLPIVAVGEGVVEEYASLKANLDRHGARLDDFDLLIAATAIYTQRLLVTNNAKHFARIPGLRIETWISA